MGTNFYVRIKTSEEEKDFLKEEFNSFLKGAVSKDTLISIINNYNKEVHLGKRSAGWQFLWDHNNGEYYDLTLDSIEEFVEDKGGGKVYDEYGDVYDWKTFITEEIGHYLYKEEHLHNAESYNRWVEKNTIYYTEKENKYITIRNKEYQLYCNDFTTPEGLRFSKSTDFS